MTHPTWELPVSDNGSALVLTPCPGTKGVDLVTSLEQLKAQGVTTIVTALSFDELKEKGVETLGEQTEHLGMRWIQLVIEDDCAPDADFLEQWKQVSASLTSEVNQGDKIAMHCMGGSGRTGLLAAHLLLDLGWDLDVIKQQVQALRPGAFTKPVQIEYIDAVAGK
ncbi:cyclin-dependent kinase inhibitor 3 family protein [Aliivibrio fischeri]|uniref:Phosphatase n=1 Tax=Aliivibrio fischeri TaxID=668 RepID=A0A6N3Z9K4_ALIFS|nr:cyclin-dependent kinase inhibitor 3 family protein [Aliivibrio fischeri]MCE7556780.1 cyclin-dependent kinase inhibitor 3 family protein [Aliivibrio fischeri]MCE7564203.1 cyclin-dependent kinase inhibitor 3 family protein [Aliivibrio fischeri]MCE7571630.1 cyclin-dependent kinase inhibitor 3 family protein [Aliivibrio fischeri]MCE7579134.1 cyclin-dependent kinase inhibitor 3 family protein [Aliivibrio fischeri]MCE7591378.1 cyclin-dependent kinase inhibitor 3 family protein [Aliivibrio fischer